MLLSRPCQVDRCIQAWIHLSPACVKGSTHQKKGGLFDCFSQPPYPTNQANPHLSKLGQTCRTFRSFSSRLISKVMVAKNHCRQDHQQIQGWNGASKQLQLTLQTRWHLRISGRWVGCQGCKWECEGHEHSQKIIVNRIFTVHFLVLGNYINC